MESDLYWLVFWDGERLHVAPHHAQTRQLAKCHGLEYHPGLQLKAVISDGMGLTVQ